MDKKIRNILTKNHILVDEYEKLLAEKLEPQIYNIKIKLERMALVCTITPKDIIKKALNRSINQKEYLIDVLDMMINEESINTGGKNITKIYFEEINNIYKKNNNNYNIEWCKENRDKLIQMNLKNVISIAKKYQGMGLSLNELISAGNVGLCIAFDKYDPSRNELQLNILKDIAKIEDGENIDSYINILNKYFTYGKLIEKFNTDFWDKKIKKSLASRWVKKNIYAAKFNSVAALWIKAYILIELDNKSRLIKKPKSEIYKDKLETGSYQVEKIISLDQPIGDDSNNTINDLIGCDDGISNVENDENYSEFRSKLKILLNGVCMRNRRILFKKYGIGLPRPMLPKEISDQEDLSVARISQILQDTLNKMKANAEQREITGDEIFELLKYIY